MRVSVDDYIYKNIFVNTEYGITRKIKALSVCKEVLRRKWNLVVRIGRIVSSVVQRNTWYTSHPSMHAVFLSSSPVNVACVSLFSAIFEKVLQQPRWFIYLINVIWSTPYSGIFHLFVRDPHCWEESGQRLGVSHDHPQAASRPFQTLWTYRRYVYACYIYVYMQALYCTPGFSTNCVLDLKLWYVWQILNTDSLQLRCLLWVQVQVKLASSPAVCGKVCKHPGGGRFLQP